MTDWQYFILDRLGVLCRRHRSHNTGGNHDRTRAIGE